MINLYAYTYPSAKSKFDGFILTKVGDSIREAQVRMDEQGGAAEYEAKITVGTWNGLGKIKRDFDVHKVLKRKALWHRDGAGTEWFKIPAQTEQEAFQYIDGIVKELEGRKVRNKVVLRDLQKRELDKAMDMIDNGKDIATIIANLCPRFGKTIWSLMLFNEISKKYGNKVMLLPAYWLSVHSSFDGTLDNFEDFEDIVEVRSEQEYNDAIEAEYRVILPISLHGELDTWMNKHQWISDIDNNDMFVFADEGDFGTHADNQKQKLQFIFNEQ